MVMPTEGSSRGDSVIKTAERLTSLIQELSNNTNDEHIVLVTHGGTIRDFLTIPSEDSKKSLKRKPMEGIRECSITQISVENETIRVDFFDNVNHLT